MTEQMIARGFNALMLKTSGKTAALFFKGRIKIHDKLSIVKLVM